MPSCPQPAYVLHLLPPGSARPAAAALASLVEALVAAGFPSPAEDYRQAPLDFNAFLVPRPAATFVVRVAGESMREANVHDGDMVIIDRSVSPWDGDIVVACVEGELTIKRLRRSAARAWLEPANPAYPPIEVNLEADFAIEGVVMWSLHRQRRAAGAAPHGQHPQG